MLQGGINLIYIRDFLGYSTITSTEIYARTDSEMKRKALEGAYQELNMGETPTWEKDGDLMNGYKIFANSVKNYGKCFYKHRGKYGIFDEHFL